VRYPYAPVIGGVDAGECDKIARILPTPSFVQDFKKRVFDIATNVNDSVRACPTFPEQQRRAWTRFYEQYMSFVAFSPNFWNAAQEYDQNCSYSKQLDAWISIVKQYCPIVGPTDIQGGNTSLKWISAAVIAGAVGLGLILYGPSLAAGAKGLVNRIKR